MLIVEVYKRFHLLGCSSCNKPFDCCLFLHSQMFLLPIVVLPFCCEEVGEVAQPLALPPDFSLLFTEAMQPLDIHCNSCISYGFYSLDYHIVHLKALPQQVQVVSPITRGYFGSWFGMEYIAINEGPSSHGRVDCWLPVMSFYIEGHVICLLRYPMLRECVR